MVEADIKALLNPLVDGRVYWDTTPDGVKIAAPIILLQQVGGRPNQYATRELPSHKHMRLQVRTWTSQGRAVAAPLARLIEDTLVLSDFVIEVVGAPTGDYDDIYKLYGTYQQFNLWYPDP
jgi:hypothetical protein